MIVYANGVFVLVLDDKPRASDRRPHKRKLHGAGELVGRICHMPAQYTAATAGEAISCPTVTIQERWTEITFGKQLE